MKWTRERKIYAGLLGLGLAALGADRLTRPGPDAAAAAEDPASLAIAKPPAVAAPPKPAPASKAPAVVTPAKAVSLTERLKRAATVPSARASDKQSPVDVFRPSKAWSPPPPPPPPPTTRPATRPVPPPDEVALFRKAHRLTGVLVGNRGLGNRALINGAPLRVGQSIAGFRLLAVDPTRATFEHKDGKRLTLTLDGFAAPTAAAPKDP